MIKVVLTADTSVRLEKGREIEVTEQEAARLLAFGVAEKKTAPKKAAKKKG